MQLFLINYYPTKTLLQNIADKNKIKYEWVRNEHFTNSSCYELCIKFKPKKILKYMKNSLDK